jgi:hypothetical protein
VDTLSWLQSESWAGPGPGSFPVHVPSPGPGLGPGPWPGPGLVVGLARMCSQLGSSLELIIYS